MVFLGDDNSGGVAVVGVVVQGVTVDVGRLEPDVADGEQAHILHRRRRCCQECPSFEIQKVSGQTYLDDLI